jgi:hypothetical protein
LTSTTVLVGVLSPKTRPKGVCDLDQLCQIGGVDGLSHPVVEGAALRRKAALDDLKTPLDLSAHVAIAHELQARQVTFEGCDPGKV